MPSNLTQEEETNRLMKELEGEYVLRTGTQMPHAPQSPIKALSPREIEMQEMHDFSKALASIPAVPTHPIKAGSSEAPRHAGKSQDDSGAVLAKSARRKPLDGAKAPVKPQSKTEANLPPKKPGLWSRFVGQWKATAKVMDEVGKKTTFLERGWARLSAFVKILRHGGVKDAAAAAQSETKSISKDSSTLKTEKTAQQTDVEKAKDALKLAKKELQEGKAALAGLDLQIEGVKKQILHTEDPAKVDQLKKSMLNLEQKDGHLRQDILNAETQVRGCRNNLKEAESQFAQTDRSHQAVVVSDAISIAAKELIAEEKKASPAHPETKMSAGVSSPAGGFTKSMPALEKMQALARDSHSAAPAA